MTALFALATSLLWGLADFGGGLLTRRTPGPHGRRRLAVGRGRGPRRDRRWPPAPCSEAGPQLWYAVAAGVVGPVAMLSFYKALALGPMGVVSPLGSLGCRRTRRRRSRARRAAGAAAVRRHRRGRGGHRPRGRARAARRARPAAGRSADPARGLRLRRGHGADRRGVHHPHRTVPRAVRAARHQCRGRRRGALRLGQARRAGAAGGRRDAGHPVPRSRPRLRRARGRGGQRHVLHRRPDRSRHRRSRTREPLSGGDRAGRPRPAQGTAARRPGDGRGTRPGGHGPAGDRLRAARSARLSPRPPRRGPAAVRA